MFFYVPQTIFCIFQNDVPFYFKYTFPLRHGAIPKRACGFCVSVFLFLLHTYS